MTDNEKIARWVGFDCKVATYINGVCNGYDIEFPDYSTDSEAVQLLNVLVEKGYNPTLSYYRSKHAWVLQVFNGEKLVYGAYMPTIHEVLTRAVLHLIEKEANND